MGILTKQQREWLSHDAVVEAVYRLSKSNPKESVTLPDGRVVTVRLVRE